MGQGCIFKGSVDAYSIAFAETQSRQSIGKMSSLLLSYEDISSLSNSELETILQGTQGQWLANRAQLHLAAEQNSAHSPADERSLSLLRTTLHLQI